MVRTGRACGIKLFRQYFEHWKAKSESEHLIAGGAFAQGIEVARRAFYVDGMHPDDAMALGVGALLRKYGDFEPPEHSAKTAIRTAGALEYYFFRYPLGNDGANPLEVSGKLAIEFSFAIPLPVLHPVTKQPLLYCGRSDMVAKAFGGIMIYDEKTTTSLGPKWLDSWHLDGQFIGYAWALRQAGIVPFGCCIRGISILKTKYDTLQALVYPSPFLQQRWFNQLCQDLELWKTQWATGTFNYNLGESCKAFGGCFLRRGCQGEDHQSWLAMSAEQRVWDPIAREQVSLEDWKERWEPGKPFIQLGVAE